MTPPDERSDLEKIAQFCDDSDLPWDDERADRMGRYLDLLMQFNESMNLIGPLTYSEIIDELLIDSLAAAAARRPRGPILDVGTGAGLPGIPIKIAFPDSALTLVEPRQKRSTFLKIAVHRLQLSDVDVFRGRIEEFDGRGFDVVISKAFQPPEKWLRTAVPFTGPDGAVVCMARRKDHPQLVDTADELGLKMVGTSTLGDESENQRVCFAFER